MASHTVLIAALYDVLPDKLAELGLDRVYEELELPLCPVLAEMEQAGMLVDLDALTHFGEHAQNRHRRPARGDLGHGRAGI